MINAQFAIEAVGSRELLARTRELARQSVVIEADLLVHIAEVDERKLYLEGPFPSMFAFCVGDLGFSQDAAYNRITVARAARRFPAIVGALRSGAVHLAGLRLLAPHLTTDNHREVLASAAGKSKRDIEELVARLAPQPAVPDSIRKLPERNPAESATTAVVQALLTAPELPRATMAHRLMYCLRAGRCGDRWRFAVGRTPRTPTPPTAAPEATPAPSNSDSGRSRHVPDPVKRAVYERDGGRCTWTDERGRRCLEKGLIQFDHVEGFARTREHTVDGLRLLCRPHNQAAAEKMYGRDFMERKRTTETRGTRPGTSRAAEDADPSHETDTFACHGPIQPLLL